LHCAALNEEEKVTRALLEKGANPDLEDNDSNTPYEYGNKLIKQTIEEFRRQKK
jgi:ankyrin repeat protein